MRRNLLWIALTLTASFLSVGLFAQTPPPLKSEPAKTPLASTTLVQIKSALQGDFSYRFLSKNEDASAPTPLPPPTNGVIALPVPDKFKVGTDEVEILDNTKGNSTRLPLVTIRVVELSASNFKTIQAVYIPVQNKDGKPITGASVALNNADKTYHKSYLLAPADNGIAKFEAVPMGDPITITVSYAGDTPVTATEMIPAQHPPDGHHRAPISVPWTDAKIATGSAIPVSPTMGSSVDNARPDSRRPARDEEPPPPQSGGSSLLSSFIGLLAICAVGYGLFHAYKTGKVKTLFEQVGINTADPGTAGANVPLPFTQPEQPPITPITEGTADPFGALPNAAPVATGPRLVGTMGTYSANIFPLNAPSVTIGRDPSNPIPLAGDGNTSRIHATLQNSNGQVTITDNSSANGTFVNGVRISAQAPHPLRPGDELQIGMTRFRFEA